MDQTKILDTKHFTSYVGAKTNDQREMASLFQKQTVTYLKSLKDAYEKNSSDEWHAIAHQIKGLAAFSGAFRLLEVALSAQNNTSSENSNKRNILNLLEKEITLANQAFDQFLNH